MNESVWELAISLAAIVAVVWLFLGYSKHYSSEAPKARILYISGYAVLIIIELIVYICLNNFQKADVMSTVSFGATLSSLIMSVVAIIFTIVSGKDGREQLGRINEATDQLQQTAATLGTFQVIADHIDDRLDEMYSKVCGLESGQKNTIQYLQSMENSKMLRSEQNDSDSRQENLSAKEIDGFISTISPMGILALVACGLSMETGKNLVLSELAPEFDDGDQQYLYGIITATVCSGLFDVKNEYPQFIVKSFTPELLAKAQKRVESILQDNSDQEYRSYVLKMYNRICTYFGKPLKTIDEGTV